LAHFEPSRHKSTQSSIKAKEIHKREIKVRFTGIKTDAVHNFSRGDLELDGVVDLDDGVGVPDGTAVVGHKERNAFGACLHPLHLAQLVLESKRSHHEFHRTFKYLQR
jgi:hypothetical protein